MRAKSYKGTNKRAHFQIYSVEIRQKAFGCETVLHAEQADLFPAEVLKILLRELKNAAAENLFFRSRKFIFP